jgi:hypothetical protein
MRGSPAAIDHHPRILGPSDWDIFERELAGEPVLVVPPTPRPLGAAIKGERSWRARRSMRNGG